MKLRKILCPTDFSQYTEAALDYASMLAAETNATLFIVHVDEYYDALELAGEGARADATEGLVEVPPTCRERLGQVVPTRGGVEFERHYLCGGPIREIVDFAERELVDLIVIGSHGRTGISRLLTGSVAEGVARRAPCPVMIIKQPHQADVATPSCDATARRETS